MSDDNFPPIALTIAGSDSGGGAGIQADLKSYSALGVYGASVITSVTAQNTVCVTAVHEIPANIVTQQIEAVLADLDVKVIKIGMLFSSEIINAVVHALKNTGIPIILDPVMIAKSGEKLLQDAAIENMVEKLFPLAHLITPNLPEAATFLKLPEAQNFNDMQQQAKALLALGAKAVLLKGGHSKGDVCTDLLFGKNTRNLRLDAPRIDTKNTHGTGCTYSAAIVAYLAKGDELCTAITNAHAYLQGAIKASHGLKVGLGHGPVHHFYKMWAAI